jgi:hypothetical protein
VAQYGDNGTNEESFAKNVEPTHVLDVKDPGMEIIFVVPETSLVCGDSFSGRMCASVQNAKYALRKMVDVHI